MRICLGAAFSNGIFSPFKLFNFQCSIVNFLYYKLSPIGLFYLLLV